MKVFIISLFLFFRSDCIAQELRAVIHFEYNKSAITPEAMKTLDSIIKNVSVSTVKEIDLAGHCDSIGNNNYNDNLSMQRVTAVKDYFTRQQFPDTVFKEEKGFGKRQPLNNNASALDRYLNRRVEIILKTWVETAIDKPLDKIPPASLRLEKSLEENIRDTAVKTGTTIILNNMNFIGGRHVLLPQSIPILVELLKVLQDNPNLVIEIDGHICCTFGAEDGIDLDTGTPNLSVNRARAIYEYLIGHGINKKRLFYKGMAHSMPLVYPEDTEEKRTTNRRVEIKIIRK